MKRASIALAALALFSLAPAWSAGTAGAPLRFGILPDSDSIPFMVAQAENLFAAEGVNVEIVRFTSPVERDAAFQAGAVDGVISDVIAAALAVQGGFDVRIVSVTDGRYGLVAAPGGSKDPLALKGKSIGLSTNTIIQYLV
ncbi:MAG: ABC transporter substrate-binding protein, partial [Spirochaetales bacterium]